jgi:hypothetical protein
MNGANDNCFICGGKGHFAHKCPRREEVEHRCFRCGRSGDLAHQCRASWHVDDSAWRKRSPYLRGGMVCYRCGRAGHNRARCREVEHVDGWRFYPPSFVPAAVASSSSTSTAGTAIITPLKPLNDQSPPCEQDTVTHFARTDSDVQFLGRSSGAPIERRAVSVPTTAPVERLASANSINARDVDVDLSCISQLNMPIDAAGHRAHAGMKRSFTHAEDAAETSELCQRCSRQGHDVSSCCYIADPLAEFTQSTQGAQQSSVGDFIDLSLAQSQPLREQLDLSLPPGSQLSPHHISLLISQLSQD